METVSSTSTKPSDSWESVTDQPFCSVCQMAFKTQGFLDRHSKYSNLHKMNVQARENLLTQSPEKIDPNNLKFDQVKRYVYIIN